MRPSDDLALRTRLEGALERLEAAEAGYTALHAQLRARRWLREVARQPARLRALAADEPALEAALERVKRCAGQTPPGEGAALRAAVERLERLRGSTLALAHGKLAPSPAGQPMAGAALFGELERLVAFTSTLAATHWVPEESALAWSPAGDALSRGNPYSHLEFVFTAVPIAVLGTFGTMIVAGISTGSLNLRELLFSLAGAAFCGWASWKLSEVFRSALTASWRSLRLGLSVTGAQRLVVLGEEVLLQSFHRAWVVRPQATVLERSLGPASGRWRFRLESGEKVFSRLSSSDADSLEALLLHLGFRVRAGR